MELTQAQEDAFNRLTGREYARIRGFPIWHYKATQRTVPASGTMSAPWNADTLTEKVEIFKANGQIFREEDERHRNQLGSGIVGQGIHMTGTMPWPTRSIRQNPARKWTRWKKSIATSSSTCRGMGIISTLLPGCRLTRVNLRRAPAPPAPGPEASPLDARAVEIVPGNAIPVSDRTVRPHRQALGKGVKPAMGVTVNGQQSGCRWRRRNPPARRARFVFRPIDDSRGCAQDGVNPHPCLVAAAPGFWRNCARPMKSALWRCGEGIRGREQTLGKTRHHRPARRGFRPIRPARKARAATSASSTLPASAGTATSYLFAAPKDASPVSTSSAHHHASARSAAPPRRTSSGLALRRRHHPDRRIMPGTPTHALPAQPPAGDPRLPLAMLPPSRGMQGRGP